MNITSTPSLLRMIGLAAVLLFSASAASAQEANAIKGHWRTHKGGVVYFFKATNGMYYGRVTESKTPEFIEEFVFLEGEYDADDQEWEGTLRDLEKDRDVTGTLSLEPDGRLKVVGSVAFISKTFHWTRVD